MLNEYSQNLKNLIHELNQSHQDFFIRLKSEILFVVQLPNKSIFCLLLNQNGIKELENCLEKENVVYINYHDLLRLINDPSKIVRYLFQGKIKLKGDTRFLKELIEILKAF
ncbi:MAG: SCP2 sterol-binding domain-containing protein [Caldimicrobium sp.]